MPNVFWSIGDGNWNNPNIWSHTENGPSANDYPVAGDIVHIIDNKINVTSTSRCSSVELIVEKANTELVVSSTTLEIRGQIKLSRRSEGFWADVKVLGANGKIRLIE